MADPFAPLGSAAGASLSRKKTGDWTPIIPVPVDAPPPPSRHPQLGAPTVIYTYRAADVQVNGYVLRFATPADKEFRPLTYCAHDRGVRDWRWMTWRDPRPLYRLDELRARTGAPVLVAEGEKACHAAEQLATSHVCITSPGGAKAAGKADWAPLRGRNVIIWPDADDAGHQYAAVVAKRCRAVGVAAVSIVKLPDGVAQGWDAADALAEGWDEARFTTMLVAAAGAEGR